MKLECRHCGARLRIDDARDATKVLCPMCKKLVTPVQPPPEPRAKGVTLQDPAPIRSDNKTLSAVWPNCSGLASVPETYIGGSVRCWSCGKDFYVTKVHIAAARKLGIKGDRAGLDLSHQEVSEAQLFVMQQIHSDVRKLKFWLIVIIVVSFISDLLVLASLN